MTKAARNWLAVVTCIVAALTCGGCGSTKDEPMRVMAEDEATRIAEQHAQAVIKVIAPAQKPDPGGSGSAPCEGRGGEIAKDGRYYVQHIYQVPVSPDRQIATLERLRDHWRQAGYEIQRFRVFPDGKGGEVAARNAQDGYQISVETTDPPTAVSLAVYSPCLMPPGKVSG
ncbi:hypothetical protein [Carbonactinospora thermoautotrophica]|nr:hypothetical protein [Carbonactinospora thermoautotrophica]